MLDLISGSLSTLKASFVRTQTMLPASRRRACTTSAVCRNHTKHAPSLSKTRLHYVGCMSQPHKTCSRPLEDVLALSPLRVAILSWRFLCLACGLAGVDCESKLEREADAREDDHRPEDDRN